ncbi:MAG: terminase large subunit [Anaerolineales bacterium]|jgi:phage terminase large subunit-like protein
MALLERAIGAEAFSRMVADPVEFVRAFDRDPWPYQVDMLRQVTERDERGIFKRRVAVVSMPRQNGKSTIAGWVALWRLYCSEDEEIITTALDRAGAEIVLRDARRIIGRSGVLSNLLDQDGLTKSEIRLQDDNRWIIRPADAQYSRGYRPSLVIMDELGWVPDHSLFDALLPGMAARPNPLMLAVSTVGPIQAGPLWELFEAGKRNDPWVRLIYVTENLSPLITEAFLESQRGQLPPHIFAREHQNLWGEGSGAFATDADWKRATEDDPTRDGDLGPCYLFCDLGWVHDETAIAVAKPADGAVAIVAQRQFRGSQVRPVSFAAVQTEIETLRAAYHVRGLQIESPQGVGLAQELRAEVLHPTAESNRERWGALYQALKAGTIRLPPDPILRRQLLTLTIQENATGWRVVDVPSIHQDRAVAVAGALFMAKTAAARSQFGIRWL